ncbi:flagellar hook-basal body complex protein [bacterium]|nr:flagellar hook-basal body complex protein [bacterium]
MLTGLYSAASGMIIQERVQDVLAQNLATSQIPGTRRKEVVIRSFPDAMLSETYRGLSPTTNKPRYNHAIGRVGTGAGVDWVYTDHTEGQMVHTGNKTDIALFGDGYFTVLTPDGFRFTRQGNFHVDQEGDLATQQGFKVVGQGINQGRNPGPINVGRNDFWVDEYGNVITRQPDQNGIMTDTVVDQIKITDFHNKDLLFAEPGNVYRVEEEEDKSNFKIPEDFRVAQGYIERSNSVPTTEMVKLIDSYRTHEASARVLKSLDQTLRKAVNEIAGR